MVHGQVKGKFGVNRKIYLNGIGYVANYLPSDNLNVCVAEVLKKRTTLW